MGAKRQGWITAIGIIVLLLMAGSVFARDAEFRVDHRTVVLNKACYRGYRYTIAAQKNTVKALGVTQDFQIKTRVRYHQNKSQIVEWTEEYSVPVRCK